MSHANIRNEVYKIGLASKLVFYPAVNLAWVTALFILLCCQASQNGNDTAWALTSVETASYSQ